MGVRFSCTWDFSVIENGLLKEAVVFDASLHNKSHHNALFVRVHFYVNLKPSFDFVIP